VSDPTTDDADLLFEQADSESEQEHHETAAALFGQAAQAYRACGNDGLAALAINRRAVELHATRDYPAAASVHAQAAALAALADDTRVRLSSLCGRADSLAQVGEWSTVRDLCHEAIALMREYDFQENLAGMLLLRAKAEYWLDCELESLASTDEATAAFRAEGVISGQLASEDFAVTVLLFLDRDTEAEQKVRRNLAIAALAPQESLVLHHRGRLGEVLLASGKAEEAATQFAQVRDGFRAHGWTAAAGAASVWLGRALAAQGRHAEAAAALRTAVAVLEAASSRWSEEADEAKGYLAAELLQLDDLDGVIETDRGLLIGRARAGQQLQESDASVLERLTMVMVQRGRAAEVGPLLQQMQDAGCLGDGGAPRIGFTVSACRVWALSEGGDTAAALPQAERLLQHPDLCELSLSEAWLLQIAGAGADPGDPVGMARLARSLALHLRHDDVSAGVRVGDLIVQRTSAPSGD
jgi:tetratricopeptide (TPR) repeat protein